MGDKLEDNFWTIKKIAEAFQKGSYKIEGCGEEIRDKMTYYLYIKKKVKEILKEIDCPESIFRKRGKKIDGHFIFEDDDSVPDKIYKIFEFYDINHDKICGSFMSDEENKLMGMLYEIRPTFRQKPGNKAYTELRREQGEFYIKKYLKIYTQKFFVKVDVKDGRPDKRVRSYIYTYQVFLVSAWCEKWSQVMKSAMHLRVNERILNGYQCGLEDDLPDEKERKKFYLEGNWYDELEKKYLMQDRLSEKEIYDACCNLYYYKTGGMSKNSEILRKGNYVSEECRKKCVSYVKEILSHSLLGVSIDDYLYLMRKAMRELEDIHTELEQELKSQNEYDEMVYRLKQVQKTVREGGLRGKKNKKLEKILNEIFPEDYEKNSSLQMSTGCSEDQISSSLGSFEIDDLLPEVKALAGLGEWQYMLREINSIRENIREQVEGGKNDSVINKNVIDFCDQKIKEYYSYMELKVDRKLYYSEYKKYYLEEIKKTKINEEIDYCETNDEWCKVLVRIRQRRLNEKKGGMLMADFLPEDEKNEYWSMREFCTGRELI